MNENLIQDIKIAEEMRNKSYSPYSKYTVGCVLVCNDGTRYTGCNIENNGIQSICAERVAFVKAISDGKRDFKYIVVVGGKENEKSENECLPCGYCRQFINEIVKNDFRIYTTCKEKIKEYRIDEILPYSFKI